MKKHLNLIGAAVAATLGTGSAFALAPNTTFDATLTVAGSSAFEAALESELGSATSSVCASGTFNIFKSNTNDFRAYTCSARPNVLSVPGGEAIAIYYRGEGGSVTGLAPVARNITQSRLDLASCPTSVTLGSTAIVNCTTVGYDTVHDTATSGVQAAQVQLGFADLEPAMFVGENYPSASVFAWVQPALTTSEVATLSSATVLKTIAAQSFSVYVTDTTNLSGATQEQNALSAINGLSRTTLASIFRGAYADWSQVPASPGQNGSGFVVDPANGFLPIKLCRREAGSGTQTGASIFFNDYLLSGQTFATTSVANNLDESLGGGGVKQNLSTGSLQTCLQDAAHTASGVAGEVGAIGYFSSGADLSSTSSVVGYKHLLIDGQGDTATNQSNLSQLVADGRYDYWYELVSMKRPGIPTAASNIADKLITATQKQATGPTSAYITFLPTYNTPSYPLAAPPSGKKYIGCLTRGGKSTNKAIWQCL